MRPVRRCPILIPILILVALLSTSGPSLAQGPASARKAKAAAPSRPAFSPEREAAALVFVRRHHPELLTLLERLKPMNGTEYEKAIVDLFVVSETVADLQQRDPRRAELAIEAWQARSRVRLLAAQVAADPGKADRESELRQALEAQIDVEIRQQKYEREQAEARVRKLGDTIGKLERERSGLVEARMRGLVRSGSKPKKFQESNTGRPAGGSRPARPEGSKTR